MGTNYLFSSNTNASLTNRPSLSRSSPTWTTRTPRGKEPGGRGWLWGMVQVSGHGGSDPGGGQNYPGQSNGSGTHRTDKCAARTRAFGLKQAEKQWDNGHSRKVRSATTASGHFDFEMPASFRVSFEDTRAAHGGLRGLPAVPGFLTWPQSVARSGSPSPSLFISTSQPGVQASFFARLTVIVCYIINHGTSPINASERRRKADISGAVGVAGDRTNASLLLALLLSSLSSSTSQNTAIRRGR